MWTANVRVKIGGWHWLSGSGGDETRCWWPWLQRDSTKHETFLRSNRRRGLDTRQTSFVGYLLPSGSEWRRQVGSRYARLSTEAPTLQYRRVPEITTACTVHNIEFRHLSLQKERNYVKIASFCARLLSRSSRQGAAFFRHTLFFFFINPRSSFLSSTKNFFMSTL